MAPVLSTNLILCVVPPVSTSASTNAAGRFNKFEMPVPAPLFVQRINEALAGNVAPAPTSESA